MAGQVKKRELAALIAGATLCCFLWGSAFPVIKIGYQVWNISEDNIFGQVFFAGIRFFLAGMLAVFLGSLQTKRLLLPKKETLLPIIHLALLQTTAQYFFFYVGLAHTSGVNASIIGAMNSFIAVLLATLVYRQERLTGNRMAGCILGFSGVLVIQLWGNSLDMSMHFTGEGFILLSTVSAAFSSVYLKKYSAKENPVLLSGYQFMAGGLILSLWGVGFGGFAVVEETDFTIVHGGIVIYLALVSAVAYSLWGILIKKFSVARVAVFGFLIPVFGVLLSGMLLGEWKGLNPVVTAISLLLVSVGTLFAQRE